MLKIIKVTGNSLSPFFLPGDYVVIGMKPLFSGNIHPGDFIVFDHEEYGRLIKKVLEYDPDSDLFNIIGAHPLSLDSRQVGPVASSSVIRSDEYSASMAICFP